MDVWAIWADDWRCWALYHIIYISYECQKNSLSCNLRYDIISELHHPLLICVLKLEYGNPDVHIHLSLILETFDRQPCLLICVTSLHRVTAVLLHPWRVFKCTSAIRSGDKVLAGRIFSSFSCQNEFSGTSFLPALASASCIAKPTGNRRRSGK